MAAAAFTPPNSPAAPGPFVHGFAVVAPSNTVPLPFITRGIYVGGAGDVLVLLAADTRMQLFKAVHAGTIIDVCATQVRVGTTATSLICLA